MMTPIKMKKKKTIGIVAHDERKADIIDWVKTNKEFLKKHNLVCTGTTGRLVREVMGPKASITALKSGPLGGDQQLGARISEGLIDILIFFWDPMTSQPHDVDVKALLRITVLYNIPTACNRSTADFFIHSDLFDRKYKPLQKDYSNYTEREL